LKITEYKVCSDPFFDLDGAFGSKKRLDRPIRNGPRIAPLDLIVIDEILHLECDPEERIGNSAPGRLNLWDSQRNINEPLFQH